MMYWYRLLTELNSVIQNQEEKNQNKIYLRFYPSKTIEYAPAIKTMDAEISVLLSTPYITRAVFLFDLGCK